MQKSLALRIFPLLATLALTPSLHAADPAPDVAEAIRLLSTSDPQNPDAATRLQAAMIQQEHQILIAQQLVLRLQDNLAKQLHSLTGLPAEQSAATAGILEFQSAISHWGTQVAALPREQRDLLLDWAQKTDNLQLLAAIYGRDETAKQTAILTLGQMDPSPTTDLALQLLINEPDRELALLAMDAIIDRKPTPAITDAVADRLFTSLSSQIGLRNQPQRNHTLTLHGRTITIYDNNQRNGFDDPDMASDFLIKINDPRIRARLDSLFTDLLATADTNNPNRLSNLMNNLLNNGQWMAKLLDAYKPKSLIPVCIKMLQSNPYNSGDQTINTNGTQDRYHYSSRLEASALLLAILGRDPADYGLVKLPNFNNRWLIKGSVSEENDMLVKLRTYLTDHAKELSIDPPAPFAPTPLPTPAPGRGRATVTTPPRADPGLP